MGWGGDCKFAVCESQIFFIPPHLLKTFFDAPNEIFFITDRVCFSLEFELKPQQPTLPK